MPVRQSPITVVNNDNVPHLRLASRLAITERYPEAKAKAATPHPEVRSYRQGQRAAAGKWIGNRPRYQRLSLQRTRNDRAQHTPKLDYQIDSQNSNAAVAELLRSDDIDRGGGGFSAMAAFVARYRSISAGCSSRDCFKSNVRHCS